jgi:hypothetical protein
MNIFCYLNVIRKILKSRDHICVKFNCITKVFCAHSVLGSTYNFVRTIVQYGEMMDLGVLVYVYSRLCHEIVCGVIKKVIL